MTSKVGAHWCVTFNCNLACKHCSLYSGPHVDRSNELTAEQASRLITQMAEVGVNACRITGGEPLVRKDIYEIFRMLHVNEIPFTLETNGVLLTQKNVSQLRRTVDSILAVAVSLDGARKKTHEWLRGKNTFTVTLESIERLVDSEIPTGISFTVHRGNLSEIDDICELSEKLGIQNLRFEFMNRIGRAESIDSYVLSPTERHDVVKDIVRLASNEGEVTITLAVPPALVSIKGMSENRIYVGVGCNFPVMGILPNGDLSVCCLAYDKKELIVGNIKEGSLREVWLENDRLEKFCKMVDPLLLEGVCAKCIFKSNCKGGCRLVAYDRYGRFNAPLPICQTLYELKEFPLAYLKQSPQNYAH